MRFRRRVYRRGSSFETTIPRPLLFHIDPQQPNDVVFEYDAATERWWLRIEPRQHGPDPADAPAAPKKRPTP